MNREIIFVTTNNIGNLDAGWFMEIDPIVVADATESTISDILDAIHTELEETGVTDINYAPVYADTRELYTY